MLGRLQGGVYLGVRQRLPHLYFPLHRLVQEPRGRRLCRRCRRRAGPDLQLRPHSPTAGEFPIHTLLSMDPLVAGGSIQGLIILGDLRPCDRDLRQCDRDLRSGDRDLRPRERDLRSGDQIPCFLGGHFLGPDFSGALRRRLRGPAL